MRQCGYSTIAYRDYISIDSSKSTVKNYLYNIAYFFKSVKKHPSKITEDDMNNIVASMMKKNLSASLISMRLASLSNYYAYLKNKKIFNIGFDIMDTIKHPPVLAKKQRVSESKNVLSLISKIEKDESIKKFVRQRYTLALLISATTGGRINEITNLTIENIDIKNKEISFYATKNKKPRMLPMFPLVEKALEKYLIMRENILIKNDINTEKLFITVSGRDMNTFSFMANLRIYSDKYKEKFTWHGIRRGFASELSQKGVDIERISKALGHQNVAITSERYIYTSGAQMKEALAKHSFYETDKKETTVIDDINKAEPSVEQSSALLNILIKNFQSLHEDMSSMKKDIAKLSTAVISA